MLRARATLTVNKVLTPIMLKYNVKAEQAVVCFAGTADIVDSATTIGTFCPRALTVMSTQQYIERRSLAKRDLQKELAILPTSILTSSTSNNNTNNINSVNSLSANNADGIHFHQHGDVGFFEISLESENSKNLKNNATRSYSSNPKVFIFFQHIFH